MHSSRAPHGVASPLVVIPCLNEAAHIAGIVELMHRQVSRLGGRVVVVDGGSTDGTLEIIRKHADRMDGISLLENPARLQSVGVNAAVAAYGTGHTHLVRVDAHCAYPEDYVRVLLEEAELTGASAVVVSMIAQGDSILQRINASTQNSRIGNGGSRHRVQSVGEFVEHGHHALIRLDAFREVGGYDPNFSHNEDAEFDYRLTRAGHRIWLTGRTRVTYFPRRDAGALARQYFNHGRGRSRNLLKHRTVPNRRQMAVIGVAPAVALATLAPASPVMALPAALWSAATLASGLLLAARKRSPSLLLSGPVAMLMHLSWSAGFWVQAVAAIGETRREATP